ncbi:hypothetical protein BD309DRAFT_962783 [Dichomitus squalens]|nr:hypothetical protein BD309DRAFT_962783 [Dichomitus squalens]
MFSTQLRSLSGALPLRFRERHQTRHCLPCFMSLSGRMIHRYTSYRPPKTRPHHVPL